LPFRQTLADHGNRVDAILLRTPDGAGLLAPHLREHWLAGGNDMGCLDNNLTGKSEDSGFIRYGLLVRPHQ